MKSPAHTTLAITTDYRRFVEELKERVATSRLSAARRTNHEMIFLYWDIGRGIVEKQKALGWGESVVELVAEELRRAFPSMRGFSPRNVRDMKRFYLAYSDEAVWRQPVAKSAKGVKGAEIRPQVVAKLKVEDAPATLLHRPGAPWEQGGNWPQAVAKLEDGNPIGVAAYALQSKLPGELKGKLPTAKQLSDIVRAEMED